MMLNSNCNHNEILHPPPIPLTEKNPGSKKKAHLHHGLKKPENVMVREFIARMCETNDCLTHFPSPGNRPLSDTEMVEIIDRAKPHEWHAKMLEADVAPHAMSLAQLEECFKRLETAEKIL